MSYIPIENLDLKVAQIEIPSQTFTNSNTDITISNVTNGSYIVTIPTSTTFKLKAGRSYFISTGIIGSYGNSNQEYFDFYNHTTSSFMQLAVSRRINTHATLRGFCVHSIEAMLTNLNQDTTLSIRKIGTTWGSTSSITIPYNSANLYYPNSVITIMYTDTDIYIPSASLVAMSSTLQLTSASLNIYHSYSLTNSGYVYWLPTTPSTNDTIGFIHLSGVGNFSIEYPKDSGTYLTGGSQISSSSTRKSFIFQWNGTTWIDIGQFTVV